MPIDRTLKGSIEQGSDRLYPQYRGEWEPVPFAVADLVRYNNSLYVAEQDTLATDTPGISPKWQPVISDGGILDEASGQLSVSQGLIDKLTAALTVANKTIADTQLMGAEALVRAGVNHVISSSSQLGTLPQSAIGETAYSVGDRQHFKLVEGVGWQLQSRALLGEDEVVITVPTLAALRSYSGPAQSVVVTDSQRGGTFLRTATPQTDDDGNHISGVANWKRQGYLYDITSYGGKAAYGAHDNTPAWNAVMQAIKQAGNYTAVIYFPSSSADYYFNTKTDRMECVNVSVVGDGEDVTRLVGNYPGALFHLGRKANTPGTDGTAVHASGLRFQRFSVKNPYSRDPRYYRPGRVGWTHDASLVASSNGKYVLADPDPADMASWVIFNMENCSTVTLQDVKLDGCYQAAWFGSPTSYTSAIYFVNVRGYIFNRGLPAITVYQGAGFSANIPSFFVQAEHPEMKEVTINGAPHLFMETMTTKPGSNMFNIRGHWDTWGVSGNNSLFERFYNLYSINVTAGHAFSFINHQGVVADYFAGDIIDFENNVGSVSLFDCGNMRASPVHGRLINMPRNSGYVEMSLNGASSYMGGREIMNLANPNLISFEVNGGRFHSGGFLNGAIPYTDPDTLAPGHAIELTAPRGQGGVMKFPAGASISIGDGVKNYRINNAEINRRPGFGSGTQPWYTGYGVIIGVDSDEYSISNCVVDGQYIGLIVSQNTAPSTRRRITNVISRGTLEFGSEGFVFPSLAASGSVTWNNTPLTLSVGIGGGTVTKIDFRVRNGIPQSQRPTGRTSGEFTLQPGEGLLIDYSVAPVFTTRPLI